MKRQAIFLTFSMASSAFAARLPDLYPPDELMGPSFWEQYQWLVCGGVALCLGMAIILWWFLHRPPVAIRIPADIVARRSLETLSGRGEDGVLAGQVSRVIRDYLPCAIELPRQELTADEVAVFLRNEKIADTTLKTKIVQLLRDCDTRKYGTAHEGTLNLVSRALELVEDIEAAKQTSANRTQTGISEHTVKTA